MTPHSTAVREKRVTVEDEEEKAREEEEKLKEHELQLQRLCYACILTLLKRECFQNARWRRTSWLRT